MFSKSVFALAALVTIAVTPIAHALQSNGADPQSTTESWLTDNGWSCSTIGAGFDECTKDGSTTYWCDGHGDCAPAPMVRSPRHNISVAPSAGLAVSNPTTISNPRGTVLVPIRALVK